jgi:uncharacterized protein
MVNRVFLEGIKAGLAPFRGQLVCAYLFGSQARGDAKPASDVDVAILFRQDPPRSLDGLGLDIAGAIEAELGQPVDLVVLNRASPDLVHRVLRDSVLLLETDRAARVTLRASSAIRIFRCASPTCVNTVEPRVVGHDGPGIARKEVGLHRNLRQ